ncbi:MAG: secretin N-terminal domain-containing protein [Gemmatimonadota bacterium]
MLGPIDLAPLVAQEPAQVTATADGVTLDFRDADLRSVVAALAEAGGLNVVYGDLPARVVTLRTNAPVPRADMLELLRTFADANGLEVIEQGGLLRIQPSAALAGAQVQPPDGGPVAGGGAVRLWVYRLRHAKAAELAQTIGALFGQGAAVGASAQDLAGASSDRTRRIPPFTDEQPVEMPQPQPAATTLALSGTLEQPIQIVPHPQTNSLLVRASEADWEVVRSAVEALDLRPLQVLIEVLIAEVRRSSLEDLGLSIFSPDATDSESGLTIGGELFGSTNGDLELRVGGIGGVNADALISALSTKSDVTILSRPVVFVQNNELARILVGSERPFIQVLRALPTENAVRDQVIQYRDVGTALTIRPTINPDGYVSMEVIQEVSTATAETQFGAPVISTRQAETQLMVRDGQTIVIGGLIDQQSETSRSGIPLLKDIPVLGYLFGSTRHATVNTELFLFITPHVVASDDDVDRIRSDLEGTTRHLKERLPDPRSAIAPTDPFAPLPPGSMPDPEPLGGR